MSSVHDKKSPFLSYRGKNGAFAKLGRLDDMNSPGKYLIFANQADMEAEAAADPVSRTHFRHMAAQWRELAACMARAEALRPGGAHAG